MPLSLNTEILKRYQDIVLLMLKYGDKELIRQGASEQPFSEDEDSNNQEVDKKAEKFAEDLESLSPTFRISRFSDYYVFICCYSGLCINYEYFNKR